MVIEGAEKNIWTRERKLHNEKLYNLYSLSYIIRTMNSRSMIWAGYLSIQWENLERLLWMR